MISGIVKAFNLTIDYVLYDLSYVNLVLYGASLPSYKGPKGKNGEGQNNKVINGDDPTKQAEIDKLFDETNRS